VKIGGKLRVLHQENDQVSILTEIVRLEPDYVVCRATVQTAKGTFSGIGVATLNMDARIGDAIVSLSETRAVARACRHSGYAMDSCGAEELAFVEEPYREPATQGQKLAQPCAQNGAEPNPTATGGNGSKASGEAIDLTARGSGSKPQHCGIDSSASNQAGEPSRPDKGNGSKRQPCPIEKPQSNGAATSAQVRALYALTKRAKYHEEDIANLLAPFRVARFEELPREAASQLIGYLQQEVAA
jgi:hypothetical protein